MVQETFTFTILEGLYCQGKRTGYHDGFPLIKKKTYQCTGTYMVLSFTFVLCYIFLAHSVNTHKFSAQLSVF